MDIKTIEVRQKWFNGLEKADKERIYTTKDADNTQKGYIFWLGYATLALGAFIMIGGIILAVIQAAINKIVPLELMLIVIIGLVCFLVGLSGFQRLNKPKSGVVGDS